MAFSILRLDEAKIFKKYEIGRAEVKFYTFASDERLSLPELEVVLAAKSPKDVRGELKKAAAAILNRWESLAVHHVRKTHVFNFGDTGKIIYRSNHVAESIDWIMLAVEIDDDVRRLGDHIDEILPDSQVETLAGQVKELASSSASPVSAAAVGISKFLIRGVTRFMKNNENDQVGIVEQSFLRVMDYPSGSRSGKLIQDLSGNMWYSYTLLTDDKHSISADRT